MSESSRTVNSTRKRVLTLLRMIVTVALCIIIIRQADWNKVILGVREVGGALVLLSLVLMLLSVTISTYKWRILLSIHGISFAFSQLQQFYFIAIFFNNVLPTSIGGDGYRIYKTLDNARSKSSAVIAVLMERITGLSALFLLGYFSAIWVYLQTENSLARLFIILGTIGLAVSLLLLLLVNWRRLNARILSSKKAPRPIKAIAEHLVDYSRNPGKSWNVVATSFWFQLHNSLPFFILLHYGVGASISFPALLVVLALLNIVALLPISINGIGLMEGSLIFLSGQFGVPYDAALVVMLLIRILVMPLSAIGALFYFRDKRALARSVS